MLCFFVCTVMCGAVGGHVWEVSVFRYAAVVCLCPVAVLNGAFCMTCKYWSKMQEATIWKRHTPEPVS